MSTLPAFAAAPRSESKVFYGWIVAGFAAFAVAVTNGLSIGGIPVFYRSFISEFGWSRTTIATAGAALLLTRGLLGPFTGPLWDRYGPKRFMVIGAAVIGLALIAGSLINAPLHLYLMILLMAIGLTLAGLGPAAFLASSWFTNKRGLAMGIVVTGTSFGGMIFSPLSTWLISMYGWRSAMTIYAVFTLTAFVPLMYFFIKNRPIESGLSADPDESDWFMRRQAFVKSVMMSAAIVGALIYSPASTLLISSFGRQTAILIFAALGLIGLGTLTKYFAGKGSATKNGQTPKVDLTKGATGAPGATMSEAIRSVSFWALLLGSSLCYYVIFAITQQFILHLQSPQVGFNPAGAAWAYSTLFFFSLSGKSLFGFLSDRFPKSRVNLVCALMMLAGALILLRINQSNTWFFCVMFGLGYGGITVTTKLVLADRFGTRSLGKLLGLMMGAETIFGGGGNLLTGRLFDVTGSYQTAFWVMAGCSIVSVLLMAPLGWNSSARSLKSDDVVGVS
jgi:MFS family permease